MSKNQEYATKDLAQVTVETSFDAPFLLDFIRDIERIFRINSLMEFTHWEKKAPCTYAIGGKNLSNNRSFDTTIFIEPFENGVNVRYGDGIKSATHITLTKNGTGLTITDDYSNLPVSERQKRLDEVDKSIVQWGHDIHRYLRQTKRYAFIPGWQWYMRRVWQPMKPSSRRICALLIMITTAEFVVFLAVFTIFWLELDYFL